jgi:hypothetical protein
VIKEKHLVPGRVLLRLTYHPTIRDKYNNPKPWWRPCMVVAYYPDIQRRHSRKTAPVTGWEVLVIWFGTTTKPVEHVRIQPEHQSWKPGPI